MADHPKPDPDPDRILAGVARSQRGLVTSRQAEDAGLSRQAIRSRLRSGRLVRVGRRVFSTGCVELDWEQAALAACLDLGRGAVLSHRTAARVWHLELPPPAAVEVTVPYGRAPSPSAGVVVHRTRTMTAADRTVVADLPVTTPARTLVDLAEVLPPAALAAVVDEALCRRLVLPERLARFVDRLAPGGRRVRPLRSLLAPWMEGGAALESVAEARFLRAIRALGLARPVPQHLVDLPGGRTARLDFAWPEQLVALEIDGFRWHADPASHARDSARANALAAGGWTVLRATPREVEGSLAGVVAAIEAALARPAGRPAHQFPSHAGSRTGRGRCV